MTITKEIERLEHSAVRLTLTVGRDELRSEYDEIVRNYAKSIQIPGFRKGKVPREILIRKFSSVFDAETLSHVIEHSVSEVFEDESFPKEDRPLGYSSPALEGDPPELDLETDLVFSVTYDVIPKITVGPWKGLEVEARHAEIGDEDVGRELEAVRERNAVVLDRDDGAKAAKGDVLTVGYAELSGSGEILPGTERQDFVFTLGTGYNAFAFDDDITGMAKGETRVFDKSWPEDFSDPELAGKTKKLTVTLTALKEKQLPELDDDLAQDVDEKYGTLQDLRDDIRGQLSRNLGNRLREIRVSALLEKILETTPVDLPESMIRVELEGRWRSLARQFNADPDQLAAMMDRSDRSRDAVFTEWRPDVMRSLQSRLVVETLIAGQGIEVSEGELEAEYGRLAENSGRPLDEVKQYYGADSMKSWVEDEIKERKFFDLLLAENTIKDGEKVKYMDLFPNNA